MTVSLVFAAGLFVGFAAGFVTVFALAAAHGRRQRGDLRLDTPAARRAIGGKPW